MKMLDIVILGAGPAGITAAIYAARKKMSFVILSENIGGQTTWSADVENYTGYQFITGFDLVEKFKEHLAHFEIDVKEYQPAVSVEKKGNVFVVKTDEKEYLAKTVIVATGRKPRLMNVDGEVKYKGRGVTYCATCDGPFFAGKEVAVIGGGNSGLDAALQLLSYVEKVYLVEVGDHLIADPVMVENAKQSGKFEILLNTRVKKVVGDTLVQGLEIEQDGDLKTLPVKGIFVEIGSTAVTDFLHDVKRNAYGEIEVNCKTETNVPGLFGAGDVTDVYAKQIVVACAEGCKSTLAAFEYLSRKTEKYFEK